MATVFISSKLVAASIEMEERKVEIRNRKAKRREMNSPLLLFQNLLDKVILSDPDIIATQIVEDLQAA